MLQSWYVRYPTYQCWFTVWICQPVVGKKKMKIGRAYSATKARRAVQWRCAFVGGVWLPIMINPSGVARSALDSSPLLKKQIIVGPGICIPVKRFDAMRPRLMAISGGKAKRRGAGLPVRPGYWCVAAQHNRLRFFILGVPTRSSKNLSKRTSMAPDNTTNISFRENDAEPCSTYRAGQR